VLNGDHATRGEASPVTDSVDFIEDRDAGIARSQEVRVKGVHATDLDRSSAAIRAGRHLSAKRALTLLFGVSTSKSIDLDLFEVEQIDKQHKGFGHVPLLHLGLGPRGSTPKRN